MKCPKCNTSITEEMLVCPHCKKVLKLICPKCNTINKNNTCKKCGFVIISKCHKCGKINQTIKGKCAKCGFSTYTSVAINSSNIDEFACLTIEFPNLADIKTALSSIKLTEKFKSNLDALIKNYAGEAGLTREVIEEVYVIRFNKDNTFKDSCLSAMKAAIEIQNLITNLNFKLNKAKDVLLESKIAVLKRDIYAGPSEYKSGFNIKLIYDNKKEFKLINCLQVVTDTAVYEQVCDEYDLKSLSSVLVKNEMIMFFELNLKKYIKPPKVEKKDEDEQSLAKLNALQAKEIELEDTEDKLYNIDAINFDKLKCGFIGIKTQDLCDEIVTRLKLERKKIISVKGKQEMMPKTGEIIDMIEKNKIFDNIFRVTCYDEMKYTPYGFFYELISGVFNFSLSPKNFKNNQFGDFDQIDPSGLIKDFINLTERVNPSPEEVRIALFDIFSVVFKSMRKNLIYIENFEKIDDTSYELLQSLFENFNNLDISYLIFTDKDFALHKGAHFLLASSDYLEIKPKPTQVKDIVLKEPGVYDNIIESFYLKSIAQNAKGSILFFNYALNYLIEKELLSFEKGVVSQEKSENIFIPATLEKLIQKRLDFLQQNHKGAYVFLAMILLLGPRIDIASVQLLGDNLTEAIKLLAQKEYIYVYDNTIYIQNYNLLKHALLEQVSEEFKKSIANEVLQKVFSTPVKHPAETVLYNILENEKEEFEVWQSLSKLNYSMGDFSAYLSCSLKFLKLLDDQIDESSQKTIEEHKFEVYEKIASLLYKYTPNEIYNISKVILENLEKTTQDNKKVITLCNKMLQGCLISGNYSYALELSNKILSKYPNKSLNPNVPNFDISYFLVSLVKLEVLFSIGNLKECVELGEEVVLFVNSENIKTLKPERFSIEQFEDTIFDAMNFVLISKIILLDSDLALDEFKSKIKANLGKIPDSFELALDLKKILKGNDIKASNINEAINDKFYNIFKHLIAAFGIYKNNFAKFADQIHKAKLVAKSNRLSQIELVCDLLIGYSYFKLNQAEKAASIYYNILENSKNNGLKLVTYLDWYLISVLKFEQDDIDIAFGLTSNTIIQLEKDSNSGDFLFFLLRVLLAKILKAKNETEAAELCLNNAKFIKDKYGLNFDIDEVPLETKEINVEEDTK